MRDTLKELAIITFCVLATACASTREGWQVGKGGFDLALLEDWRQSPKLWLEECDRIDPAGSEVRTTAYQEWLVRNNDELARLQMIFDPVAERLYPEERGPELTPAQFVRTNVTVQQSKRVFATDPALKAKFCSNYVAQFSGEPTVTPAQWAEAFGYLNDLITHR